MVIVRSGDFEVYLDGYLHKDLDFIKDKVLNHNNLFLAIIDGRTGTGKSTLGAQMAKQLDPNFSLDKECFNAEQFATALKGAQVGDCIVLDESFSTANKRKTQSSGNMEILSMLQMMRVKRCFIIVILPCVFDLDKNLLLNLCDMFIHCYRQEEFGPRGFFSCYDRIGLKKLWLYCRQSLTYSLKVSKPIYRGKFVAKFPLDYGKYEDKKVAAIEEQSKKKLSENKKYLIQRDKAIVKLSQHIPAKEIAELLELKPRMIYNILEKSEGK